MTAPVRQPRDLSGRDRQMTGVVPRLVGAWLFVGVPLAYGVAKTAQKASALFTG